MVHRERWDARTRELGEAQRRLAAFERISTAALETDDLDAFLHTLLTVFMGAADSVSTATILLRRADELVTAASIGMPEDVHNRVIVPVGTGFAGRIASMGRPMLLIGEAIDESLLAPWLGAKRLLALYGVPLFHDGEVIGVAHVGSTTADAFTEREKRLFQAMAERAAWVVSRKRSRDRVYSVLDAAPAAMSLWRGPELVCEYANNACIAMFPGREVVGATVVQLGAAPLVTEAFDGVLRTGQDARFEELAWTLDGQAGVPTEERFFRMTLHPLRDATGQPEAVLCVSVDLTAQVRARQALEASEREREYLLERERTAREEAELANRTKDEFLATVSHELRTPLNAILGWTSNARRGGSTNIDRALDVIERNARAQARLVEDMLDLSRVVSGKLRLDVAPADLAPSIFSAVEAVRPAADAKGVLVETQVGAPLGFVLVDSDRMQQVLWNLLSNAVKFSAQGGRVSVSAAREDDRAVIRVQDCGQGIAREFLPHVFEPFRQADGSTTRRHGGLGLGLAIVRELVHAQGGSVRAESDGVGQGATFVVELPLHPVPLFAHTPVRESFPPPRLTRLPKIRVLVVDDEADSRELVAQVLTQHGAIVEVAESAEAALRHISICRPDVLVSDIAMAETDGYALIRSLRNLPADAGGALPAIALTAHAQSEDRARAKAAGFQMHIAKPIELAQLLAGVARLAAGYR
jgi:signal transduction histidine kinase/CheY-like chemotaxis protein